MVSCLSKLIEFIIKKSIEKFKNQEVKYVNNQSGFQKNSRTLSGQHKISDLIIDENINRSKHIENVEKNLLSKIAALYQCRNYL